MKSIFVGVAPEETCMAIVEDGVLAEFVVERDDAQHIVGNVYKGRVQNVLHGMQAAFVDIGLGKNAFLYIGDGMPKQAAAALAQSRPLHIGQSVIVQIAKDAVGTKGPRATTQISLPGRYAVLMPTASYIGVSQRIASNTERERLRKIAGEFCPPKMGLIVRTAAAKESAATLRQDIEDLVHLWHAIEARGQALSSPALLYRDADLVLRIARDYLNSAVDEVVIDDKEVYHRVTDLLKKRPELCQKVHLYKESEDIFKFYHLDEEIKRIGRRTIELKSGGTLVIDKTEALTVIDVNTGKFVGRTNLSDTVYRTNLEAAAEIARQIRLRDIGGIVIVDFIDMETEKQKKAILSFLSEKVRADRTKTNVVGITPLGLVEITRKKSRRNFEATLYSICPLCDGRGRILSPETVAIRICRDLRKLLRRRRASDGYLVQLHRDVREAFEKSDLLTEIQRETACRIELETKEIHPESYSILQL